MALRILDHPDPRKFTKNFADCVIKTHDNKIVLQKRPENCYANPNGTNLFGGHVEDGETIQEALIRELKEELGAEVQSQDLTEIGSISESFTNYTEAVHVFFWHDKNKTIIGCYEGEALFFESVQDAKKAHNLMEYAQWSSELCEVKGLL